MKTLQEIKDEVALEYGGYDSYKDFLKHAFPSELSEATDKIAKAYAEQWLIEAAERATIRTDWNHAHFEGTPYIDKQSILQIIDQIK